MIKFTCQFPKGIIRRTHGSLNHSNDENICRKCPKSTRMIKNRFSNKDIYRKTYQETDSSDSNIHPSYRIIDKKIISFYIIQKRINSFLFFMKSLILHIFHLGHENSRKHTRILSLSFSTTITSRNSEKFIDIIRGNKQYNQYSNNPKTIQRIIESNTNNSIDTRHNHCQIQT